MQMNYELDHKTGFDIGWDWAAYGLHIPEDAMDLKDFVQGHQESFKPGRKLKSDRYIRKWLQLRLNAWRRNRVFNPDVTPEFIKEIDVPVCPVTFQPLTHSTRTDSDWSVDRIHNNAAYAVGNLVVVSAFANKIKGSLSMDDIAILAYSKIRPEDLKAETGLNIFEWRRWLLISSLMVPSKNDSSFGYHVVPCVIPPPPATSINPSCMLQMAISDIVYDGKKALGTHKKILSALSLKERLHFNEILKTADRVARKKLPGPRLDLWYNDNLFKKFAEFYRVIDNEKWFDRISDFKDVLSLTHMEVERQEWHAATRGYAP